MGEKRDLFTLTAAHFAYLRFEGTINGPIALHAKYCHFKAKWQLNYLLGSIFCQLAVTSMHSARKWATENILL